MGNKQSSKSSTHKTIDEKSPLTNGTNGIEPKELPLYNYVYPFENVVFEGGGFKALATCGGVRVLEEVGIWQKIRRISGVSSGSLLAALLAVGYNSYQLENFISQDLKKIAKEVTNNKCGHCCAAPNVVSKYGLYATEKLYDWLGKKLHESSGKTDVTFLQVYQLYGKEICIVVVNTNTMSVEYCHPKTTPDMPLRTAVRMSMAFPGVFQPVKYEWKGRQDLFIDGGVLCNYPIHAFDGTCLSMRPDAGSRTNTLTRPGVRDFEGYNENTVGFLLYSDSEQEIFKKQLEERDGHDENTVLPDTRLARQKRHRHDSTLDDRAHKLAVASEKFIVSLHELNLDNKKFITKQDLKELIEKRTDLGDGELKLMFGGNTEPDDIMAYVRPKNKEQLTYQDLVTYLEREGLRLRQSNWGLKRRDISSATDFFIALQQSMYVNGKKVHVEQEDVHRTVGINTCYVDTWDADIERADRLFLVEQGKKATKNFLKYFIIRKSIKAKDPEDEDLGESFNRDDLSRFIDDERSEIIDMDDYEENCKYAGVYR